MCNKTILRLIGVFLILLSLSFLPPMGVAWYFKEQEVELFSICFVGTFFLGWALWFLFRKAKTDLKSREGFFIIVSFWVVFSFFAALPLIFTYQPHLTFTDAIFETISGITTTGATVLSRIDFLPRGFVYYRQQLQFLGGMSIIILAIAILPMLGIGGMQLYRAETPGPIKDTKLTPRITQTAKSIWMIYVGLMIACALCYRWGGMTWFDAVGESFGTVATGGFSSHDASFSYYHSDLLRCICIFFMILGATNFSLHFFAIRYRTIFQYLKDEEFKTFLQLLILLTGVTFLTLFLCHYFTGIKETFLSSLFTVTTMMTSTGYSDAPFDKWPLFLPFLMVIIGLFGGCAGSTCGGLKIIRLLLIQKLWKHEFQRLIHPAIVAPIKFRGNMVPAHVLDATWAYTTMFFVMLIFFTIILLGMGVELDTALVLVAACLSNTGAFFSQMNVGFGDLSHSVKWILNVVMIMGRLEIFSLLVLLTGDFWR